MMTIGRQVLVLGLFLAPALTLQAEETARSLDDIERSISSTREALESLDRDIAATRSRRLELERVVEAVDAQVGERSQRIADLDAEIERYSARLATLETEVSAAEVSVDARRAALADAMRRSQSLGEATGLKVLLQHDDPALADRLAVYTDYLLDAQHTRIANELEMLRRIEEARAEAAKDRNWLDYIRRKAVRQKEGYEAEQAARQADLGEVDIQLGQQQQSVADLRAEETRLAALFEELKALASSSSDYFERGKGSYVLPTRGTITARFGDTKAVGRVRWKGLFIEAPRGTPVHAIADGEVKLARWIEGFGMTVFIDHGGDYISFYGGNQTLGVRQHDWVEAGREIATVGNSGGQKGNGLYLEIRHKSRALDPADWINGAKPGQSAQN